MATAEELRSEITTGFDSLREATEGASANWGSARLGIESTLRSELDPAVTGPGAMGALRGTATRARHAPCVGLAACCALALLLSLLVFIGQAGRDAFDPRRTTAKYNS